MSGTDKPEWQTQISDLYNHIILTFFRRTQVWCSSCCLNNVVSRSRLINKHEVHRRTLDVVHCSLIRLLYSIIHFFYSSFIRLLYIYICANNVHTIYHPFVRLKVLTMSRGSEDSAGDHREATQALEDFLALDAVGSAKRQAGARRGIRWVGGAISVANPTGNMVDNCKNMVKYGKHLIRSYKSSKNMVIRTCKILELGSWWTTFLCLWAVFSSGMTSVFSRQALAGRAARGDHRYCAGRVCGGLVRRLRRDWAAGGGYTGFI